MMTLGVDTSNYATSLALVDTAGRGVVCSKKRMLPVAEGQLGLRQADAVFHHTAALPALLGEIEAEGLLCPQNIAAVGVSERPRPVEGSYMPCFLAGVSFAAAFSAALQTPLVRTSHQQGHMAAARFAARKDGFSADRFLLFHLSGGTTELVLVQGDTPQKILGKTLDLYAGQALDRLAGRLGLPFPGGAEISRLAARAQNPIRPRATVKGTNCHLSGLQNQCEQLLDKGTDPADVALYCLESIAETAIKMVDAARAADVDIAVLCAGGVMGSEVIRAYTTERLGNIFFVPSLYSSDNAIGTALIAASKLAE